MSFLAKGAKGVKKAIIKPSKLDHENINFLHGTLELEVRAAKKLPNMEGLASKIVDRKDVTDPFVDVQLDKVRIVKTSVINNDLNPEWDEHYIIEVCHQTANLRFLVKDKDHAYSEVIGEVDISSRELLEERKMEGWFDIKSKSGKKGKGSLHIMVKFTRCSSMHKSYEVPAYFGMKKNCHVTLYQDADVPPGLPCFQGLLDPHGVQHEPARCWHDVYDAIMSAKHVICITGWAVWDKLQLFRGTDLQKDSRTLGELLIEKANTGVSVYVLVWSEFTSGNIVGDKGIMGTHDMETYNRFKDTKVKCALAPREISKKEFTDHLQNTFSSGAYTHHQKSIICDADNPLGSGRRRLVAFVGGLDLTGGRWDTPDHPLFSTILNEHNGDFLNNNAPTVSKTQGPREPWHDIHSKVEGPIAYDVYQNFSERWKKQAKKEEGKIDKQKFLPYLDLVAPAPLKGNDPNQAWNVQFFRSITSDSAKFDKNATSMLNSKKGRIVESSIAQAYIQMIRNAGNFIYIENQYFMGSAFGWFEDNDTNCNHIIPMEIAQKIVDKISKKERFTAYIMIPMFPEGDPASAPIQEILHWQRRTIEMMYQKVGKALLQFGLNSHPTDWLLFVCPGKRESTGDYLNQLESPDEGMAKKLRETLRFPIYVHSKMMIVDDAYIIVGSANINQRSMAGTRDTEMAVGCWQPAFPEQNPYGDVHMFRMSLWAEHMCTTDPAFKYPGTKECVQKFKDMIHHNWACYISQEQKPAPGHCLPYPLNIMPDGTIETIDGVKDFPDFPSGSRVMGKKSNVIPQKVTT